MRMCKDKGFLAVDPDNVRGGGVTGVAGGGRHLPGGARAAGAPRAADGEGARARAHTTPHHASLRPTCRLATPPPQVDLSSVKTGFNTTRADNVAFIRYLADAAHGLGLAFSLKVCMGRRGGGRGWPPRPFAARQPTTSTSHTHTSSQTNTTQNAMSFAPDLVAVSDFAINEQCMQFNECDRYAPFIAARKPVFSVCAGQEGAGCALAARAFAPLPRPLVSVRLTPTPTPAARARAQRVRARRVHALVRAARRHGRAPHPQKPGPEGAAAHAVRGPGVVRFAPRARARAACRPRQAAAAQRRAGGRRCGRGPCARAPAQKSFPPPFSMHMRPHAPPRGGGTPLEDPPWKQPQRARAARPTRPALRSR